MHSIELTNEQMETLIESLRGRENVMFNQSQIYKNTGNKEAQMDCINEWKKAKDLRERLQEAVRTYQDRERTRVREEAVDCVEWQKELERDRRDGAGTD